MRFWAGGIKTGDPCKPHRDRMRELNRQLEFCDDNKQVTFLNIERRILREHALCLKGYCEDCDSLRQESIRVSNRARARRFRTNSPKYAPGRQRQLAAKAKLRQLLKPRPKPASPAAPQPGGIDAMFPPPQPGGINMI